METVIQPMVGMDVPLILSIEQVVNVSPCKEGLLRRLLEQGQMALVLKDCEKKHLLGYVCFSSVCDESELLITAVSPSYQGKGLGALLLGAALEKLRESGIKKVFLEVRTSNVPAISLYGKLGFSEIGIRKNYYPPVLEGEGREDALLFELGLSS